MILCELLMVVLMVKKSMPSDVRAGLSGGLLRLFKIILVDPPAPISAVYEQQAGKKSQEFCRHGRESSRRKQQKNTEAVVKKDHHNAENEHRIAKTAAVANTLVGSHERGSILKMPNSVDLVGWWLYFDKKVP